MVIVSSCTSLQKPETENTAQDNATSASSLPVRLQLTAPQTQTAKADLFFTQKNISHKHFKWTQTAQVGSLLPTCLSPLPFVMLTSFSIPPVSARALAFSMFLLVTSCRAQQIAATVSSDRMLGPLPPGSRLTRSRIAYLPGNTHPQNQVKTPVRSFRLEIVGHVIKLQLKAVRSSTTKICQEFTFYTESRETT